MKRKSQARNDSPGTSLSSLSLAHGKRARLWRLLYGHGPGNGTLMVLPLDQGLEHGPTDFFPNPPALDTSFQFRLAVEGRFSAIALGVGLAEKYMGEHAGRIPLILKLNGKTNIAEVTPDTEPVRGAADIEGPLSLGVASELKAAGDKSKPRGGRLIVIGDSDFMTDALLQTAELANFHMASALIGWVSQRPALIDIPPKKIKSGNIVFSQDDLWALFFRVAVLLPLAALVLGVAVWLNRRA